MTNADLEIGPFERAIQRLEEGLTRYQTDTSDTQIRDGLVQRFEFTYELGHKVLKRYLEYASANPEQIDTMAFQDLIRTGNEQALLLGEWPDWRGFREMRGKTSHTLQRGCCARSGPRHSALPRGGDLSARQVE